MWAGDGILRNRWAVREPRIGIGPLRHWLVDAVVVQATNRRPLLAVSVLTAHESDGCRSAQIAVSQRLRCRRRAPLASLEVSSTPSGTATYGTAVRGRPSVVLAVLLVAAFAINLDSTIVNVALPSLVRELHATTTQLQWVVDAYNLVFAALLLTSGSFSDRIGRKWMLLGGLAVFGLASLVGGFTTSPEQLIAARAVMGLGAAMVFPATLSIIANVFTEREARARAIGIWGAVVGAAIALGPIVGGWLLERYSWSSIFFALVPVAAVGIVLVGLVVPNSKDPDPGRIDVGGFGFSTAAMAVLVYTIIEAPDVQWSSARSIAGFVVAAALFVAFVLWERRSDEPMLDVRLFRNPRFTAASGSVTIAFFTLFGFTFLITQFFQFVRGFSPLSAGVHLLPVAFSVAIGSIVGTRLAVRVGTKLVVAGGMLLVAVFYFWVAVIPANVAYWIIAVQMVTFGIGMGFTSSPATESIMGAVSRFRAGVGSAINDSTRLLGGTLGVAVIGSVYASLYGRNLTASLPGVLPPNAVAAAQQSIGAAYLIAARALQLGHPTVAVAVHHAATRAFVIGLHAGCVVSGCIALGGALLAAVYLPAQPPAVAALASTPQPADPALIG